MWPFPRTRGLRIAFQPIVSVTAAEIIVYGFEALARGPDGRVPARLLQPRFSRSLYKLDWQCRRQALNTAMQLDLRDNLSLNITPGAVCDPDYGIDRTVRDAAEAGFPLDRLIFELTELEPIADYKPLRACIDNHRRNGARLSLDDFGTGFNGLNTLIELRPDAVKIDMTLVHKIEQDEDRRSLMYGICSGGQRLGMRLIAEGVENLEAVATLSGFNIDLMQGNFFSRPAIGHLPAVDHRIDENLCLVLAGLPASAAAGDLRGASASRSRPRHADRHPGGSGAPS